MSVCLLLIDDGREDYRDRCLDSAAEHLPPLDVMVEVSDPDHRLGFAGAIQAGWDGVLESGADYVFHLESDFLFEAPVPLGRMLHLLDIKPHLAQVALKRQPWNHEEKAAGGICELHPTAYLDRGQWTEHRRHFTTNPCLYRTALCERGWPQRPDSEGHFGIALRAEGFCFAYWGAPTAAPRVRHIGRHRAGNGY